MNVIFSLLYAPVVFLALMYFDIQKASLAIFVASLLWFIIQLKRRDITILFPVFYMLIALTAYFSEDFFVLKILPLFISIVFSLFLFVSYVQKRSIILYFANKYAPHDIDEEEAHYIHKSTLFWFFVTLVNIAIHLFAFFKPGMNFWLYYSSIGWYFLFLGAGIIQYLHRKYFFKKRSQDV